MKNKVGGKWLRNERFIHHCGNRSVCCGFSLWFSWFPFQSCQADLVKDNGHKYFLSVLADPYMPVRTNPIYSDSLPFICPVLAESAVLVPCGAASPCSVTQSCCGQSLLSCDRGSHTNQGFTNSFGVLKEESLRVGTGAPGAGNCPKALGIPSAAAGFP